MRFDKLPNGVDLGFTDCLRPGVGRNVGGRVGDCACSMTGASLVVTIQPGVIWVTDTAGTFTGIANSLLRQVIANATTVNLATNASATGPRIDVVVAAAGGTWGAAPTLAVRQGVATAAATARNLLGAAALQAGDVPLVVVAVPISNGNPAAFGALATGGAGEDARRLAADLTPAGTSKHFAGATTPPVGYKYEDGGDFGQAGPWAELFAAIGTGWGSAAGGRFSLPVSGGRVKVGVGTATGARGAAAKALAGLGGEETHALAVTEMPAHNHRHLYSSGATAAPTYDRADSGNNGDTANWSGTGTENTGGGGDHNNLQPYAVHNSIIKF